MLSLPGTTAQQWHRDDDPIFPDGLRMATLPPPPRCECFIALSHVPLHRGPTEYSWEATFSTMTRYSDSCPRTEVVRAMARQRRGERTGKKGGESTCDDSKSDNHGNRSPWSSTVRLSGPSAASF